MSLVRRLTHLNVLVLAVAMLLSFAMILGMAYWTARQLQRQAAEAAAAVLAQNVAPMVAFQDRASAKSMLTDVARRTDLLEVNIVDAQGRLFAAWTSKIPQQGWLPWVQREFTVELALQLPEEKVGRMRWRESHATLENTLLRIGLIAFAMLLGILIVAANVLSWVQRRALAPLVALSDLTERVAQQQDYTLRARALRNDEVGRLAERVNEMLRRIQVWHEDLHAQLRDQRDVGQRMKALAHRDHLTGLPNRLSFDLELERQLVEAQRQRHGVGLLFVDLDQFKPVNDRLGHEAGDAVLIEVGRRMSGALRAGQDNLFRLGGDEFALLVAPLADAHALEHLAQRLLQALLPPMNLLGESIQLGASIGAAISPEHGRDAALLLRRADAAMYAAKSAGKNCYRLADAASA
ncbi:diguanylate cyclase (GGDEF)-like protein [Inhella inkyongensis]|uniref:Diguanylate cyclase (GGDEF)-like protein n=1 Tax=Inhella inkyongensis TaxID=392593 RepID=A0A840S8P9_9BURK|nr:sensor domain-containing diguanylate cyclase [Inhella inkyongensis]MBB5205888.1 diguanylate cyclase (GGDEF)-like protein [Inhella inkyongensis]